MFITHALSFKKSPSRRLGMFILPNRRIYRGVVVVVVVVVFTM